MKEYAFVCKDEERQISFFYNFEDGCVYSNDVRVNTNIINKVSWSGAVVAVFAYPFVGNWSLTLEPVYVVSSIILLGIIASLIIRPVLISKSESYFIEQNRQSLTFITLKDMYSKGMEFRKQYVKLEIGMVLFALACTIALTYLRMNVFMYWCMVALWCCVGILVWAIRPICSLKLKKYLKRDEEQ